MKWLLVIVMCLASSVAFAQLYDASVPDASVGMGGSDHTSEENDTGLPCLASSDCDKGATCVNGSCVPVKPKRAGGCTAVPEALFGALAIALLWNRRRVTRV